MKFGAIKYMEWAKTEPGKAGINLGRSGFPAFPIKDLNLNFSELEISGEHSFGYPPLLKALSRHLGVKEESVLTTFGASQAVFYVCAALLAKGDEVLIEKPAYEPLLAVPAALEAKINRLERGFDSRYQLDPDRFEAALTKRTRLVILTNPHNPSGVLSEPSRLRELVAIAEKRGVMVLIDEIYLEFQEEKDRQTAFSLGPNVVIASSLTKVFGLAGLRCGWLLAPVSLVRKIHQLRDHINVEEVFIGEQISAQLIPHLDVLRKKIRPFVEQNRSLVKNFVEGEEKLSWVEPDPGLICFPRIETGLDGDQFIQHLLGEYDTVVVPGRFFEEPRHFRLGYGIPSQLLSRGLDNIREALRRTS